MTPVFYLGTHRPYWLGTAGVRLFISHRGLAKRRTLPQAVAPWALDSGGLGYANVTLWRGSQADHPRLIEPVQERLRESGVPYVIENVRQIYLREPVMLCGTQFDLPIRRHRYFETSFPVRWFMSPCQHRPTDMAFEHKFERAYADAMGCHWMTKREGREAIPPAYTEWIARQLLMCLEVTDVA